MKCKMLSTLLSGLWLVAIVALVLGLPSGPMQAARPHYESIVGDVTWSSDQTLTTDVVVTSGSTLTIKGVTVTADAFDAAPYDKGLSDRIEIIVENGGTLNIEPGALLTATNTLIWYGVVFLPGSAGTIDGADIRRGTVGITIHSASPTIQNNNISDMGGELAVLQGEHGGLAAGIVISGTSTAQVTSNTITDIKGSNGMAGTAGWAPDVEGQPGGVGGAAFGIQMLAAGPPTVRGNTITRISGGDGGNGGAGGAGADGSVVSADGGEGAKGGQGGRGGDAMGIWAFPADSGNGPNAVDIEAYQADADWIVGQNTIGSLQGGSGGQGGDGGQGGGGLDAHGGFFQNGGEGGAGGAGGPGEEGGDAVGIYVAVVSATIEANTINQTITGGAGGKGGQGGAGGEGGDGFSPTSGGIAENGGDGGQGGGGGQGGAPGAGGRSFGINITTVSATVSGNGVSATIASGPTAAGGAGGQGGAGGKGANGGDNPLVAGNGGNGGPGGQGGAGNGAQRATEARGIAVWTKTATVTRNSVEAVIGSDSPGPAGAGGQGGRGGDGGTGGSGGTSGAGGNGGTGGNGGVGAPRTIGGSSTGIIPADISASGALTIENNMVHTIGAGYSSQGGTGGQGGDGGHGGLAGGAGAPGGSGGIGGTGGGGGNGGGSQAGVGLAVIGNTQVVNNTIANVNPGNSASGGQGGNGGTGGNNADGSQQPDGAQGSPGSDGGDSEAYGIRILAPLSSSLEGTGFAQAVHRGTTRPLDEQYVIVNNIVAYVGVGLNQPQAGAVTTYGISGYLGVTATLDYNDLYGWNTNYLEVSPGAHDISLAPLFADVNTGDFHLSADSPSIDTGTSSFPGLTLPGYDIDGDRRPQGASHDIGADEYAEPKNRVFLPVVLRNHP